MLGKLCLALSDTFTLTLYILYSRIEPHYDQISGFSNIRIISLFSNIRIISVLGIQIIADQGMMTPGYIWLLLLLCDDRCFIIFAPLSALSVYFMIVLLLMIHFTAVMKHIFMLMSLKNYFSHARLFNEKDLPSP